MGENSTRLVLRDADPGASHIRNRAGKTLADILSRHRQIRALDLRESRVCDNVVAQVCLTIRQTDQLEELLLSPVGHCGFEFILGAVRRCCRLQTLHIEIVDVPTLHEKRQNVVASDYDTSAHIAEPGIEDEEESQVGLSDEQEEEALRKLEEMRRILHENDSDSEEDVPHIVSDTPAEKEKDAPSEVLASLLGQLVLAVEKKQNLTTVECTGDAVPEGVLSDLRRAVSEHRGGRDIRNRIREAKDARTGHDALKDQMDELRIQLEGRGTGTSVVAEILESDAAEDQLTRAGIRAFVNRRLFAALGEALFECQRHKAKENEAVLTPEGEMAFIAMHLRKHAEAITFENSRRRMCV